MSRFFSITIVAAALLLHSAASANVAWTKTNWTEDVAFFQLVGGEDRIIARVWDAGHGGRAFISTDNGATWTLIGDATGGIDVVSAAVLQGSTLCGTWNGLYRSAIGGTVWNTASPTGIPANTILWSMAITSGALLAGTTGSVFRSTDNGNTWEATSGIPATARIRAIAAQGSTVYAASDTSGVFRSNNGGATWSAFASGLLDRRIIGVAVMGPRVFAVTPSGVFASTSNGGNWALHSTMPKNSNCLLAVEDLLYAGTDSSGVYRSLDSGATWSPYNTGLPSSLRVWSLATSAASLFAGTNAGIWRIPYTSNAVKSARATDAAAWLSSVRLIKRTTSSVSIVVRFPVALHGTIALYDLGGNVLFTSGPRRFEAGLQDIAIDAVHVGSGPCIVRLTTHATAYQKTVPFLR